VISNHCLGKKVKSGSYTDCTVHEEPFSNKGGEGARVQPPGSRMRLRVVVGAGIIPGIKIISSGIHRLPE
jgi:hypothetical protein